MATVRNKVPQCNMFRRRLPIHTRQHIRKDVKIHQLVLHILLRLVRHASGHCSDLKLLI